MPQGHPTYHIVGMSSTHPLSAPKLRVTGAVGTHSRLQRCFAVFESGLCATGGARKRTSERLGCSLLCGACTVIDSAWGSVIKFQRKRYLSGTRRKVYYQYLHLFWAFLGALGERRVSLSKKSVRAWFVGIWHGICTIVCWNL